MNSSNRIVFGSGQAGGHHLVPEILETGWGSFAVADVGHLRPHAHAGAFELCLIRSGEVEWGTVDSTDILREGDIYITQPNETHWGRDAVMHPCILQWIILASLGCGAVWPGMDEELAVHLDTKLRDIRTHRVRGNTKLRTAFEEILEEHRARSLVREEQMLQHGNARAALHSLLIELVRTIDQQRSDLADQGNCRTMPEAVTQAIEMLHGNAHDTRAIHRVCKSTHTSYKELNRQFIQCLGTTISQYWLRQRVRLAREWLLGTDMSVTAMALELGFSSSQHFATVFRKVTGLTPGEYRNAARPMYQSFNLQN